MAFRQVEHLQCIASCDKGSDAIVSDARTVANVQSQEPRTTFAKPVYTHVRKMLAPRAVEGGETRIFLDERFKGARPVRNEPFGDTDSGGPLTN